MSDLRELRLTNALRWRAWANGQEADALFIATELGGEVGEALNVVKKLVREERGWRGSRATVAQLAEEIADVIICVDALAAVYDIDLWEAVVAKFNATSVKVDLPHRLDPNP